jgi:hypothetical protein
MAPDGAASIDIALCDADTDDDDDAPIKLGDPNLPKGSPMPIKKPA